MSKSTNTMLSSPFGISNNEGLFFAPKTHSSSVFLSTVPTILTNNNLISVIKKEGNNNYSQYNSYYSDIMSKNSHIQRTRFSDVLIGHSNCVTTSPFSHPKSLSPAKTIGDSLVELASSTARQLEKVWDEVGYTFDERTSQLTDLLDEFRRLCTEKVYYERTVSDTFRQTILDVKEEMRNISKSLQVDINRSNLKDDPNMTLQDRLDSLEATLDPLRSIANSTRSELRNSKDKLITAHVALGTDLEEIWFDVESDLTKPRIEAFRSRVEEMEQIVSARTLAVVQLLKDCKELLILLKIDTNSNLLDKKIVSSLIDGKNDNIMIRSLSESDNCTGISSHSLERLAKRVRELGAEKRRRKVVLANMGTEIGELWEKLHVSRSHQHSFAESINGLGLDTIEKGGIELMRLHELKSAMMGRLILDARSKIRKLWEEIHSNEKEKTLFLGMNNLHFTDDLLDEHEKYIETLENRLGQLRPLLLIIDKRENILRERMEYEELQKNPERLQQRGSALTKQLMKEEKMSRRIRKDLPRLTDQLRKKLREWEEISEFPFLYKGNSYLDIMNQQEVEWRKYKESQARVKLRKKRQEKITIVNRRRCHEGSSYLKFLGKKNVEITSKSTFINKPSNKYLSHEINYRSNYANRISCTMRKNERRTKLNPPFTN